MLKKIIGKKLYLFSILLLSLFVFKPSFSLGFMGDDWLAFYRYKYHLGEWSSGQFNYLTYFLTPYGAQDISMGLLQKLFGFNPFPFFVISFIFRLMTSFTLFFVLRSLTKNNFSSFLAAIFFALTFVGLDATNWVFNFPSYISLTFWLIFFYFFFKSQFEKLYPNILIAGLFFYLSYIFAPIRMHGLTFFVVFADMFFLLRNRNFKSFKQIIQRQLILTFAFLLVRFIGTPTGDSSYVIHRLGEGLNIMSNLAQGANYSFILNPFIMMGRFILPEAFWIEIGQLFSSQIFLFICIFSIILFLPFILLFTKIGLIQNKVRIFFVLLISSIAIWSIVVRIIVSNSPIMYSQIHLLGPALLGGYFFIFTVLLVVSLKDNRIASLILTSFSWIYLSFLIPWIFDPVGVFVATNQISTSDSAHRYMIIPAMGVALYFGFIGYIVQKEAKSLGKVAFFSFLAIVITIQAFLSNGYLSSLAMVRNAEINDRIWSIFSNLGVVKKEVPPIIFYFEGNPSIIYWTLSFGFPTHMGLLYNIKDGWKLPIPLTNGKDLISAITDGKILSAFGYPEKPLAIEKVYAYYIGSKGNVIDETLNVRGQLQTALNKK